MSNQRSASISIALVVAAAVFLGIMSTVATVSFVYWYDVASADDLYVNGERITRREIERQRSVQHLLEGTQSPLDKALLGAARREVMRQAAEQQGIEGSNRDIAKLLIVQPQFLDPGGQFSTTNYEAALATHELATWEVEAYLRTEVEVNEMLERERDRGRAPAVVMEQLMAEAEIVWPESYDGGATTDG